MGSRVEEGDLQENVFYNTELFLEMLLKYFYIHPCVVVSWLNRQSRMQSIPSLFLDNNKEKGHLEKKVCEIKYIF